MDDEIGNEVSRKIKAAIKAKLVELGAYVDDELPDYIMIMVANKRSKSQMDSDLALFLNNNTKVFTTWLHTVLEKLQQVTVAAIDKKSETKKSRKRASSVESKSSSSSGKKSKKKKRRKDKKQKKKHKKQKSKDLSEDERSSKKKSKKEKPDFIAKHVGKAIIGSLKEKHKTNENVDGNRTEIIADEPKINENLNEKKPEDSEMKEPVSAVEELKPTTDPEPMVEIEENNDELSVIAVKLNNSETNSTTVMAPTRELLREHDKLTEAKPEEKRASSEDSLPAEELRRQLLLSRAQQKLRERNIATRMRSNSPEVVLVDDSNVTQPSELTVEKPKSVSDSSKLSLRPSSFGSPSVASDRQSPEPEQVSKKQISSLIVKPAEPDQPEIPSFVQVKPREFIPAEKQANKNLILKAVAAAERSIAKIPKPKETVKPARQLFTRELREKRYEKLSVTVDQTAGKHSEDKDETFISSKPPKDKTESFIKGWLEDVEEAGRKEALIIPDDLDEPLSETMTSDSQIVVTVDALSSDAEDEPNPKSRDPKVNRISDRFAKIAKPFENHKLKKEYQEFLRGRNRKRTVDGESKNERLIAELSMKFGKVEEQITRKRSNDSEQSTKVKERSSKVLKR